MENGFYYFIWLFDSNAVIGMWYICVNMGDNQYRMWDFYVEDFMLECMALNLIGEKISLMLKDEVKFFVVGYYLYGVFVNGNIL